MGETTVQEVPDAVCNHGARDQTGSVSADHVIPAHSMGSGDPYVNASSPQGHLVFGWELHTGVEKRQRVLFHMGSCLPSTPRMSQNPLLR